MNEKKKITVKYSKTVRSPRHLIFFSNYLEIKGALWGIPGTLEMENCFSQSWFFPGIIFLKGEQFMK